MLRGSVFSEAPCRGEADRSTTKLYSDNSLKSVFSTKNITVEFGYTAWTVERVLRARSTVPKGSIKYSAASSIQYSATSTGLWAHKSAASTGL